ncbi:MAG: rod shape-determining protein RodA [Actinobacteria bacterium]|nr:rod shape-determining protein RodA [Actinomycetota bacterium]
MAQRVLDLRPVRTTNSRASLWSLISRVDILLVTVTIVLSGIGALMVYSATRYKLELAGIRPTYLVDHQAEYLIVALLAMGVVAFFDYHHYEELGPLAAIAVFLGLLAVYTPLGSRALGAQRWLQVGPIQIQPSAFGALAMILAVGTYCNRHQEDLSLRHLVIILGVSAIPVFLVYKQPDLGSAIVMLITLFAMLVGAGFRARYLFGLVAVGVIMVIAAIKLGVLHHYQMERLITFLNPHSSQQGTAYNLTESKIAIGSGGIHGTGLFHGPQTNLAYVPSQQTDFIFTAVGEQLGFIGSAAVIALYGIMMWRIFRIARTARDYYGRLISYGVLALISFSVFEGIGMTIGLTPVAGIPLPFMSYGGSGVLAFGIGIGLALNVYARRFR